VPATFGAGIYQVNVMVNTVLAGRLPLDGNVAALTYSSRLMELVLGVFVFALNTVSLTQMSRLAAVEDRTGYAATLEQLLRLALFVTIPSAIGLFLLRDHVVSLLFMGGEFDLRSLTMTTGALMFHVLGLVFIGCNRGLVSGFYALKDVRTPVRIASVNLFVNLTLAWALSAGPLGFRGIALASSIAAAIQFGLLLFALRTRAREIQLAPVARTAIRSLLAAVVMGVVVGFGARLVDPLADGKALLGPALAGLILVGVGLYFTVARWLGLTEGETLLAGVARRRSR